MSEDFLEESKCINCKSYDNGKCKEKTNTSNKPGDVGFEEVKPNDSCSLFDKITGLVYLTSEEKEQLYNNKKEEIPTLFRVDKDRGIESIKDLLLKKYKFKAKMGVVHSQIYVYKDGIYKENGKEIISSEVEDTLKELSKEHIVREVSSKIVRLTCNKDLTTNKNNNLMCVNNGVLNLKTMKLSPHSSDYNFFAKIPIDYNSNAKCKKIDKFLKDVFYEEDVEMIQEFIGYCLYRSYFIKKALILFGNADGGKSTFIDLLSALIGDKNISGVSIHQLANSRFSAKFMFNKHLNIFDDLADKDIEDVGCFKMATGSSRITAEHKFGDEFQFTNYAKLLYTANKIPSPKNPQRIDEESYYGRWLCVRCDNKFDDSNKDTDKFILQKLKQKEELSGFLNYALVGLKRLLINKKFSYSKDYKENMAIMQRSNNPLVAFVLDCCKESSNKWISKEELYKTYCKYCIDKGYPHFTKEKLGRSLTQFCKYVIDSKGTKEGKLIRGWRNIEIHLYTGLGNIKPEKVE